MNNYYYLIIINCVIECVLSFLLFFFFFSFFLFQLTGGVYVSGILAMISCASFVIFAVLSVIQIAMITSRDTVVLKYKTCVILKLALAIIAGN